MIKKNCEIETGMVSERKRINTIMMTRQSEVSFGIQFLKFAVLSLQANDKVV